MLEQHGSDAVRYWAASSRLGTDAAFDPQNPTQIRIGRRLSIKILNAAKFILSFEAGEASTSGRAAVTHPLDWSMLTSLDEVVRIASKALGDYDHARALETTEAFFWTFCDDYLELVKERAYGSAGAEDGGQASAVAALREALDTMLRLFAPFVPFATEEAWSWSHTDSVHIAAWPTPGTAPETARRELLQLASEALIGVRRAKTDAKASQKTPVSHATIEGPLEKIELLQLAEADLRAVGRIEDLDFTPGDNLAVTRIELAPNEEL